MSWIEIKDENGAKELLTKFGYFHDGCIREAHLFTEHYVNEDLSMHCSGNLDTSIKFIVQRQFKDPSCIELLFQEVTRFNLVPTPKNYDSIIDEAKLGIENGEFYWVVDGVDSPPNCNSKYNSWVTAKKLKWRITDEHLGAELNYG